MSLINLKKGMVDREQCEDDRRVTSFVSLSAEGQELMGEIFPQHSSVIKQLFEELSDEELHKLGSLKSSRL